MLKRYKAIDLANYIIEYANENNKLITNLYLQKILYYLQKEELFLTGNTLYDEDIVAWKYGPVVEEVYYKYMNFGSYPLRYVNTENKSLDIENDIKLRINRIVDEKMKKPSWKLASDTCSETSWLEATNNGEVLGVVIPIELLKRT